MALIVRPMRYVSLSRFAGFSLSAERDDKRTQTLPVSIISPVSGW